MEFDLSQTPEQYPMDAPSTGQIFKNVKNIQVGSGTTQFQASKDGIFLGAEKFADAPFSVDMTGKMKSGVSPNSQVILDGANGSLSFSYNGSEYAKIMVDSTTHLVYDSDYHFFFNNAQTVQYAQINSTGLVLPSGKSLFFTGGTTLTDYGAYAKFDRALGIAGDCFLDSGKKFQVGTKAGINQSSINVAGLFQIEVTGGVVTQFVRY